MSYRTIDSTWYEAVMEGGFGAKLANTYDSKFKALRAIAETNKRVEARGYKTDKYFVVLCHVIRVVDDNGDLVSEVVTRERV